MKLSHRGAMRTAMWMGAGVIVLGIVFAAIDLGWPLWRAQGARAWTETTCEITRSDVSSSGRGHSPVVEYRHETGGRTYTGDRVSFQPPGSSNDWSAADELAGQYRAGGTTSCWYDPQDPGDAVLTRSVAPRLFSLLAAVMLVVGFLLLRFGARRAGDHRAGVRNADGLVTHVRRAGSVTEVLAIASIALVTGWIALWSLVLDVALAAPIAAVLAAAAVLVLAHQLRLALSVVRVTVPASIRRGDELTARWQVSTPLASPAVSARAVARGSASRSHDGVLSRGASYELSWKPQAEVALRVDVGANRATGRVPEHVPATHTTGDASTDWSVDVGVHLPLGPDVEVRVPIEVV